MKIEVSNRNVRKSAQVWQWHNFLLHVNISLDNKSDGNNYQNMRDTAKAI